MTLTFIFIAIAVAVILSLFVLNRWRLYILLAVSVLAVYALQPALPVRGLDFWLPTATLSLAVLAWALTTPPDGRNWRDNWKTAAIIGGIVILLAATRFLGISLPLTASTPPQFVQVLAGLAVIVALTFVLWRFTRPAAALLVGAFLFIILIFIVLKLPALSAWASAALRSLNHQSTKLASPLDLRWLGFSYIAFRFLHTLRDRQTGRLPVVSLGEYVVFIIFFPALTAGPIDRIDRFIKDLRTPAALTAEDFGAAGKRLALGLFKKFALADGLALIALDATNAMQVRLAGWGWVILYAYAFQIFFDFSGYTDIAIGLGRLMGFRLPENFNAPFLKPNLTQFWNNWHMTLTQWFRAYFFNPLTRSLRSGKKKLPIWTVILITQLATMVLIGLWHGMTVNFVLWGAWHGLGLFVHNRWSELTRARFAALTAGTQRLLNAGGTLLTFNFVALGWIFFALPNPATSFHFLKVLF